MLDRLVEEATVDAYDDDERLTGLFTQMQEELEVPFDVRILGVQATVEAVDLTEGGTIVAVCRRGKSKQHVPILDLPLPARKPKGAEWIEAYRRMVRWE